jgi:hypothetical protein
MQVVFHLGAHRTDEGRILKALLKDRALLAQRGIAALLPQRFRPVLRQAARPQSGDLFADSTAARLFADQLPEGDVARVILSSEHLLASPGSAIRNDMLYPDAGANIAAYGDLFRGDDCTFCFALRNPATLVPALLTLLPGQTYADVMGTAHPLDLRWQASLARLRQSAPEARLVVWCNEDLPFVWPEVLRRIGGLAPEDPLAGDTDILALLLTPAGLALLDQRLAASGGGRDVGLRRDMTAEVLGAHLQSGSDEEEVALPGWTQALVDRISADYAADIAEIAAMPGVEFLSP